MTKKPKPAQPLTAGESDPRRQWVYQHRDRLVRQALDGYQRTRRGALVIHPGSYDQTTGLIDVLWLSDHAIRSSGRGWPDQKTAMMVRTYDPTSEFVIVMIHVDGLAQSYRVGFTKAARHTVVSA